VLTKQDHPVATKTKLKSVKIKQRTKRSNEAVREENFPKEKKGHRGAPRVTYSGPSQYETSVS